jgi:hypothetical protein
MEVLLLRSIRPPATDPLSGNGTTARGIDGGKIVGQYIDANGVFHGYLFDGSNYVNVDYPGSSINFAQDINANRIVGSYTTPGGQMHGYYFDGSSYSSLDDPQAGSLGTVATGIDGANIVGYYFDSSFRSHGFVFRLGQIRVIRCFARAGKQH